MILEKITNLITQPINDLGYDLWGIEFIRSRPAVLRVFIDKEDGIAIEDCVRVNNALNALLDVEDLISDNYNLEISSPGMDRPLFTLAQYEKYIGEKIFVQLRIPQNDRRKFKGILKSINNQILTLEVDGKEVSFAFANVSKGNFEPF